MGPHSAFMEDVTLSANCIAVLERIAHGSQNFECDPYEVAFLVVAGYIQCDYFTRKHLITASGAEIVEKYISHYD